MNGLIVLSLVFNVILALLIMFIMIRCGQAFAVFGKEIQQLKRQINRLYVQLDNKADNR